MTRRTAAESIMIKLRPQSMRTGLLIIFFVSSVQSQETYVSYENAISGSLFFGRYNTENRWGGGGSYSLKGFIQLSYTRSSVLTDNRISNFESEYFLRFYAPQKKRFFISAGVGYLYGKVSTELWKNYPLVVTSQGVGFEGGLHLVTEDSKTRRIVVSMSYLYFQPEQELQTPDIRAIGTEFARALSADIAVVYYLGQIGLVIGPRIALDSDFKNAFLGVHSTFLIRH